MNDRSLADKLIDLREGKDLTQAEVAGKLGISNKTVSAWEAGTRVPRISTLIELAEIFDVSLEDLLDKKVNGYINDDESAFENYDFEKGKPIETNSYYFYQLKMELLLVTIFLIGLSVVFINCLSLDMTIYRSILVLGILGVMIMINMFKFINLIRLILTQ